MWVFKRRNGHRILQSIYTNTISLKTVWGVQHYYSVSHFIHIKLYLALQTTNRSAKLLSENTLLQCSNNDLAGNANNCDELSSELSTSDIDFIYLTAMNPSKSTRSKY